jgi:hypothetical protein
MLHADLPFKHLDSRADSLERHSRLSETRQDKRLGETDKGNGCLAAVRWETGDQRMLGVGRPSPALDVRLRHVEVASGFAQREDGAGDSGIVRPQVGLLFRVVLDLEAFLGSRNLRLRLIVAAVTVALIRRRKPELTCIPVQSVWPL